MNILLYKYFKRVYFKMKYYNILCNYYITHNNTQNGSRPGEDRQIFITK